MGNLKRVLTRLACLLAVASLCAAAQAQSGRRPAERRWTKTPLPNEAQPPAPPQPTPEKEEPAAKFLVTVIKDGLSFSVPPAVGDAVQLGCTSALNSIPGISARGAKDGNRKIAVETAKTEAKALTLYIGLDVDTMASPTSSNAEYAVTASYYLYLPGTAKVRTQGRVYMNYRYGLEQPRGIPGVIAPRTGGELYPYEAGQEIARRIAAMVQEEVQAPEPSADPTPAPETR